MKESIANQIIKCNLLLITLYKIHITNRQYNHNDMHTYTLELSITSSSCDLDHDSFDTFMQAKHFT